MIKILEIKDTTRGMDVSTGNRDNPRKDTFSGHMNGSCIRAPKERDFVLPGYVQCLSNGEPIKARTFLKKFIEKITLTRNACNVAYNLAGVVPTNEDCSSLREGLVELNGIEPSAS